MIEEAVIPIRALHSVRVGSYLDYLPLPPGAIIKALAIYQVTHPVVFTLLPLNWLQASLLKSGY